MTAVSFFTRGLSKRHSRLTPCRRRPRSSRFSPVSTSSVTIAPIPGAYPNRNQSPTRHLVGRLRRRSHFHTCPQRAGAASLWLHRRRQDTRGSRCRVRRQSLPPESQAAPHAGAPDHTEPSRFAGHFRQVEAGNHDSIDPQRLAILGGQSLSGGHDGISVFPHLLLVLAAVVR